MQSSELQYPADSRVTGSSINTFKAIHSVTYFTECATFYYCWSSVVSLFFETKGLWLAACSSCQGDGILLQNGLCSLNGMLLRTYHVPRLLFTQMYDVFTDIHRKVWQLPITRKFELSAQLIPEKAIRLTNGANAFDFEVFINMWNMFYGFSSSVIFYLFLQVHSFRYTILLSSLFLQQSFPMPSPEVKSDWKKEVRNLPGMLWQFLFIIAAFHCTLYVSTIYKNSWQALLVVSPSITKIQIPQRLNSTSQR